MTESTSTTKSQTQAQLLAEPFPSEVLRVNKDKGNITYVPIAEVTARLNRVLGVGTWSYTVIDRWSTGERETETGTYPVWCMAQVRLEVQAVDGVGPITRDGIGGQAVKFLRNGTGPVDIGDEWKGAMSDALKKAAQSIGTGLDLARKEEALLWERAQQEAEGNASAFDALVARYDALPDGLRRKLEIKLAKANKDTPIAVADVPATDSWMAWLDKTLTAAEKAAAEGEDSAGPAPSDSADKGPDTGPPADDADAAGGVADAPPAAGANLDDLVDAIDVHLAAIDAGQARQLRAWARGNGIPIAADGKVDPLQLTPEQADQVNAYLDELRHPAAA